MAHSTSDFPTGFPTDFPNNFPTTIINPIDQVTVQNPITDRRQAMLISPTQIAEKVRVFARNMNEDYRDDPPILIPVLKGASFFWTDLARQLTLDVTVDPITVGSYEGTRSTGNGRIKKDIELDIHGRRVLVLEDIIDTGYTLRFLKEHLISKGATDVEIAVLLDKPERREVDVPVRYTCFRIPDVFVVGYGLDHNERFRCLPYIGILDAKDAHDSAKETPIGRTQAF